MDTQEKEYNILDSFKSMSPSYMYLNDKSLISNWLFILYKYFKNPRKDLYGYRQQYKSLAEYWLKHGVHHHSYNDPIIKHGQKMWDEYLEMFERIEEVDYRSWGLSHFKKLSYL